MRESRVVPLRLIPTMKIGESVENVVGFEWVAPASGSDIKKIPQRLPRFVLLQMQLRTWLRLCSGDLKDTSRVAMH